VIKSRHGLIGLTTGEVRVNDRIYLLEGSSVPYVLRETSEEGVYALVGKVYAHGHMSGRPWDPSKCQPVWLA
jgi:hypothetical protein